MAALTQRTPVRILLVLALAGGACSRNGDKRTRLPTQPAEARELIAEEPRPERSEDDPPVVSAAEEEGPEPPSGWPPSVDPIRLGPCGIPLAVSSEGMMTADGIRLVQEKLVDEDLLAAGSFQDGALDAATLAAIRELQEREGLPQVGLPTYATVRALGVDARIVFLSGDPHCGDEGGES